MWPKNVFQGLLAVLVLASLAGCGTLPWNRGADMAEGSLNARQTWNAQRLAAEIEMFAEPVIEFHVSSRLLAAAAVVAAESGGADDEPLFSLLYRPERRFSPYYESPAWGLLPSGDSLLWGGLMVWQVDRNYSLQKRVDARHERQSIREVESRERVQGLLIERLPNGD